MKSPFKSKFKKLDYVPYAFISFPNLLLLIRSHLCARTVLRIMGDSKEKDVIDLNKPCFVYCVLKGII